VLTVQQLVLSMLATMVVKVRGSIATIGAQQSIHLPIVPIVLVEHLLVAMAGWAAATTVGAMETQENCGCVVVLMLRPIVLVRTESAMWIAKKCTQSQHTLLLVAKCA